MNSHAQFVQHSAPALDTFRQVKQEDAHNYDHYAYQPFGGPQFSDLELAESLGWSGSSPYPQVFDGALRPAQSQEGAHAQEKPAALPTQSSMAAAHTSQSFPVQASGSYGTMPIPHAASPAWSSMESPSFMADPSPLLRGLTRSSLGKDKAPVSDKKAMRRYSHNAVERRRRDNINESIQELSHIVPAAILGTAAPQTQSPPPQASPIGGSTAPVTKPNKGVVLRKSIEYIGMLRSELDRRNERVRLLEVEIHRLGGVVPAERLVVPTSPLSMWQDESAITEDEM